MDETQRMLIRGGVPLKGVIPISGSKNLTLPAIAASLLTDDCVVLNNVPNLVDVHSSLELMEHLGVNISHIGAHSLKLLASAIKTTEAPNDIVQKMRSSILVLGPLTAKFKKASVSLPGGCAIGARGVNLHIEALQALGADVTFENGYIKTSVEKDLVGCDINFPIATVTGTENTLMAAALANGTTRIINAAMEPEVEAFADLLNQMGAKISGHGTSVITIDGVDELHGTTFDIMPDRVEAGTYAIAIAATNGDAVLRNCRYNHLKSFFEIMSEVGVKIEEIDSGVRIYGRDNTINPVDVQTAQYPGFPTDLQAQYVALMTICGGVASVTENIFENRFMHIPELVRMGANIAIYGRTAIITGIEQLTGAHVMSTDLRASGSLIIAGLMASGETIVNGLCHLDRGYENIENKLSGCGAIIERIAP
ncbi:MAG: UDP-N-acetylglucosamine 1-carboxyvinyltransferase [Holosporales bacterium]|jgi:UDP-N-acetylglucosamine 1-carboxyvinyltransferase|nr:UDP-N-acetylglucosamine 1-carboxyvinyltransferase [Holosporales bacterium]